MADQSTRTLVGSVLFIDIVGYSKLLISEQSDHFQKLKEILRGTEQFRLAEAERKLLRLPTGDGGALFLVIALLLLGGGFLLDLIGLASVTLLVLVQTLHQLLDARGVGGQ